MQINFPEYGCPCKSCLGACAAEAALAMEQDEDAPLASEACQKPCNFLWTVREKHPLFGRLANCLKLVGSHAVQRLLVDEQRNPLGTVIVSRRKLNRIPSLEMAAAQELPLDIHFSKIPDWLVCEVQHVLLQAAYCCNQLLNGHDTYDHDAS